MSSSASVVSTEALPASGVSNAKLGIWLFLASEVMLFSTFFTSLIILRMGAASWPRGWDALNVPIGMINTIVLITSSVTIVMAYAKAIERNRPMFRAYMLATILLGLAFLAVKLSIEYRAEFVAGHFPSTNLFYAFYFTMTGLHGLHIIGGLILNSAILYLSETQWDSPLFIGRVEAAGLYWHFVDIVWIFLFPALYLL
jgi:heme/copper-type cytochrome/quinol oxidase subunit 3